MLQHCCTLLLLVITWATLHVRATDEYEDLVIPAEDLLPQPRVHETANPLVFFTITLEVANVSIGRGKWLQTRTLSGTVPGPTLKLKPGQGLTAVMTNKLVGGTDFEENEFSAPNETNIHFHGLHIDGDIPSDSVTRVIYPQEYGPEKDFPTKAFYYTDIPAKHLPGTHWMHPHRHGSSTLQVAGAAAAAIIVEDLVPRPKRGMARFRPGKEWTRFQVAKGVDGAKELLLIFQPLWDMHEVSQVLYKNDPVYRTNVEGDFTLVNGRLNPIIKLRQHQWTRLRIINTAYTNVIFFDFFVDTCDMYLLAKDGIYIQDFPRRVKSVWPAPGGRADVMIRCHRPGFHNVHAYTDTRDPTESNITMSNVAARVYVLRRRRPKKPAPLGRLKFSVDGYAAYLARTIGQPVDDKCSCETDIKVDVSQIPSGGPPRFVINDHVYHSNERIHRSVRGKLQERHLLASVQGGHPYHQHVIPYQINRIDKLTTMGESLNTPEQGYGQYFKVGDWHDVFSFDGILRFNPSNHTGKMILHCHKLDHEDEGMMSTEEILPETEQCMCGWSTIDKDADEDFGGYSKEIDFEFAKKQFLAANRSIYTSSDLFARAMLVLVVLVNVVLLIRYFKRRDKIAAVQAIEDPTKLLGTRRTADFSTTKEEATPLISSKPLNSIQ